MNLDTVKGYQRIMLIQELRDEVDLNLGLVGSWASVLPAVLDARLFPTPWLNKVHLSRHAVHEDDCHLSGTIISDGKRGREPCMHDYHPICHHCQVT